MKYDWLPDVALSVQQPWAWLISYEFKDIENRDTLKNFRGHVAIHSGKRIDESPAHDLRCGFHPVSYRSYDIRSVMPEKFETGGIVGVAEIYDCVTESDNEWFVGKYGFMIRNASPVSLIPCAGALGFFKWKNRVL